MPLLTQKDPVLWALVRSATQRVKELNPNFEGPPEPLEEFTPELEVLHDALIERGVDLEPFRYLKHDPILVAREMPETERERVRQLRSARMWAYRAIRPFLEHQGMFVIRPGELRVQEGRQGPIQRSAPYLIFEFDVVSGVNVPDVDAACPEAALGPRVYIQSLRSEYASRDSLVRGTVYVDGMPRSYQVIPGIAETITNITVNRFTRREGKGTWLRCVFGDRFGPLPRRGRDGQVIDDAIAFDRYNHRVMSMRDLDVAEATDRRRRRER